MLPHANDITDHKLNYIIVRWTTYLKGTCLNDLKRQSQDRWQLFSPTSSFRNIIPALPMTKMLPQAVVFYFAVHSSMVLFLKNWGTQGHNEPLENGCTKSTTNSLTCNAMLEQCVRSKAVVTWSWIDWDSRMPEISHSWTVAIFCCHMLPSFIPCQLSLWESRTMHYAVQAEVVPIVANHLV